jgi:hypothetical protein
MRSTVAVALKFAFDPLTGYLGYYTTSNELAYLVEGPPDGVAGSYNLGISTTLTFYTMDIITANDYTRARCSVSGCVGSAQLSCTMKDGQLNRLQNCVDSRLHLYNPAGRGPCGDIGLFLTLS